MNFGPGIIVTVHVTEVGMGGDPGTLSSEVSEPLFFPASLARELERELGAGLHNSFRHLINSQVDAITVNKEES